MRSSFHWWLATGLAMAPLALHPAHAAPTISVYFSGSGSIDAWAQPGIVAGADWNQIAGASGSDIGLHDSNGAAPDVSLAFSASGLYDGYSGTGTANSATNTLYEHGLFGDPARNGEVAITLSGIPFSDYSLYVYASPDTANTSTLSISDGAVTFYFSSGGASDAEAASLLPTLSTTASAPTAGPGQYQVFAGLTAPAVTLTTGGSIHEVLSANVFGLQIVDDAASVPEPGSLALLGVAAAGLRWVRRRRR